MSDTRLTILFIFNILWTGVSFWAGYFEGKRVQREKFRSGVSQ